MQKNRIMVLCILLIFILISIYIIPIIKINLNNNHDSFIDSTSKKQVFSTNIMNKSLFSDYNRSDELLIVNHTSVSKFYEIPNYWINQSKNNLHIAYQHTSHGSQLVTGMNALKNYPSYGNTYEWSDDGTSGLDLDDYGIPGCADLSQGDWIDEYGVTPWVTATRNLLNDPSNSHINVIMWSWCSINGHNITRYLENMEILVADYPDVDFIFMTGHAEGQGEGGFIHTANEQIRQHCIQNNRILFDFAEIESFDPDGEYFYDRPMWDDLDYNLGRINNWGEEWIDDHVGTELEKLTTGNNVSGYSGCSSCAHSDGPDNKARINCVLKGQGVWWMMAKLAGWNPLDDLSALFFHEPLFPTVDDVIFFYDDSTEGDGIIVNWSWSFGNGDISYTQNPIYQYNSTGNYSVCLNITDDLGATDEFCKQIRVFPIDQPIFADFAYLPVFPNESEIIYFTDTSMNPGSSIDSWYWDFSDGNISTEQNPTHQFDSSGRYQVTLTVTDDEKESDSHCKHIPVGLNLIFIQNLSSGWNFVSLPYNESLDGTDLWIEKEGYYYGLDDGIINQNIFGWNRTGQYYTFANTLKSGYGHWVFAYDDCELWVENISPNNDEYITTIDEGWNAIGIPYDQPVDKDDLLVDGIDWNTAVSNGWVSDYVFGWNKVGQLYVFSNVFETGHAYWMYAHQECCLAKS